MLVEALVEVDRVDPELAGLVVCVGERQPCAVDDVSAAGRLRATERHADVDVHMLPRLEAGAAGGTAGEPGREPDEHGGGRHEPDANVVNALVASQASSGRPTSP